MPPAGRHVFYGKKPCRRFTHSTHYNIRSRAGRAPPLRKKACPLRGKVARYAPDEGRMSGNRNFPPHQSPSVTASPKGESHRRGLSGRLLQPLGCGRGNGPPLLRNVFYCPVGRADLTPPGSFAAIANCPLISRLRRQLPPKGEPIATKKRLCSHEHRRFGIYHPGRVTPESASIF